MGLQVLKRPIRMFTATTTVSNAAQSTTSVALPVLDGASDKRNFDLLQGQWRCQSSIVGANDKLKINYEHRCPTSIFRADFGLGKTR